MKKKKRRIASLVLALVTMITYFSMPASAYVLLHTYWPSKTVYYAYPSGLATVYRTAWQNAINDWNSGTGMNLVATTYGNEDIYCRAVSNSTVTW